MLRDSAVVRTRPRAIPLPMITMRKSIHGFLFPYMVMGLRLELRYEAMSNKSSTGLYQSMYISNV